MLAAARAAKAELESAAASRQRCGCTRETALLLALGFGERRKRSTRSTAPSTSAIPRSSGWRVDPRVDGLRSEPRFQAMLKSWSATELGSARRAPATVLDDRVRLT